MGVDDSSENEDGVMHGAIIDALEADDDASAGPPELSAGWLSALVMIASKSRSSRGQFVRR
ncbi:hypothetical protein EEB13_31540 [Rhodococcus sp. WS3]|nr:hypothetical protein EEB13_31540 [Rhodococcus sp. WS3]